MSKSLDSLVMVVALEFLFSLLAVLDVNIFYDVYPCLICGYTSFSPFENCVLLGMVGLGGWPCWVPSLLSSSWEIASSRVLCKVVVVIFGCFLPFPKYYLNCEVVFSLIRSFLICPLLGVQEFGYC